MTIYPENIKLLIHKAFRVNGIWRDLYKIIFNLKVNFLRLLNTY